ncbi:ZYBA0S10-00694g1_1 [Zygosaccharomyces bailii CLIB 213]|uniref:ZYBA0S10-00694g1_1 n=1 Tax=Zygosaccharomyces bailii (strain CLIB 213 / ATCC 58445 / CBS 680 / BCRC 21525 / NBRC 1098 / NCYC 1416 / NRRL Y-2227) TaxID=1333698 RepID=A0A8J2TBS1_ZYGB2|nr:ZYBA0S10-00694g1_1 [Zygosaccharomyces bailii CLIB 213]
MSDKETVIVEEKARDNANMTSGGNAAFHNFLNDFADIEDPLERRRLALQKIDEAKFGWYHVRAIMVAGVGFLTDSYDIFAINLGVTMMSYVFWKDGNIPSSTQTLLKVSTSVGTVVGQLGFGVLADVLGRKKIYGVELIIMIFACVLQCTAGESAGINFPAIMTFYRIVMGIGIGGDYPLSSIITSEFSTTKWRGAIMSAVFANQAWGQIAAGIVALVLVEGYKDQLKTAKDGASCGADCKRACDQMWRILIGLGCVPGCIALYFRLTIPESPRYTLDCEANSAKGIADASKFLSGSHGEAGSDDVARLERTKTAVSAGESIHRAYSGPSTDIEQQVAEAVPLDDGPPKASFKDFWQHFRQWKYGKILLGTAGSWFCLDVGFYGLGLNTAVILEAIGYAGKGSIYKKFHDTAVGNLILICAGSLPGYWATVFTIDIVGRKPIQLFGFFILVFLFCLIGFDYHNLSPKDLLGLYIICEFFQNFGPNVTTFVVPGEIFPTRYRSSAHGISAASGKIGAIIAQTALGTLIDHNCARDGKAKNCWLPHVMEIFALFMLVGLIISVLVPETKRMTLEEVTEKYHDEIDPSKYRQTSVSCGSDTASGELEHV